MEEGTNSLNTRQQDVSLDLFKWDGLLLEIKMLLDLDVWYDWCVDG